MFTSASQHLAAKNKMNKPDVVMTSVRRDKDGEELPAFDSCPENDAKRRLRVKTRPRPLSSSEMLTLSRIVWMASIVMAGMKKGLAEQ